MWPFTSNPEHRLHHRLLDRLRQAYVVGEDLTRHDLSHDNLKRVTTALHDARDDAFLFERWMGKPMNEWQALAATVETRLWTALGTKLHELVTQSYYPDAYEKEAEALRAITENLQHVLHIETILVTKWPLDSDQAYLQLLKGRYP